MCSSDLSYAVGADDERRTGFCRGGIEKDDRAAAKYVAAVRRFFEKGSKGGCVMYSEKVMDHFKNPRNMGEIEGAKGVGTVGNAKCGDIMRMYLDIDENGVIKEAKFKTFGCGAAIATSSMATELVTGKTVQDALKVTNRAVMEALDGLPPVKEIGRASCRERV